jgi:hypothetical protein
MNDILFNGSNQIIFISSPFLLAVNFWIKLKKMADLLLCLFVRIIFFTHGFHFILVLLLRDEDLSAVSGLEFILFVDIFENILEDF